mgnify:CR=1 FL=1
MLNLDPTDLVDPRGLASCREKCRVGNLDGQSPPEFSNLNSAIRLSPPPNRHDRLDSPGTPFIVCNIVVLALRSLYYIDRNDRADLSLAIS